MKFLIGLLTKIYILVLIVFISNILLQLVMLEILLDGELRKAERMGCFDESGIYQQIEKFKMLNKRYVTHIEVDPKFTEYAEQLGAPMSVSIQYRIQSPILQNNYWLIRIQRKGVNTGYYGNGYFGVR